MIWHEDESNLDQVAYSTLNGKKRMAPKCCSSPSVHVYAQMGLRRGSSLSSAWVWCSRCGAYSHLDGLTVDADWENCEKIDSSRLCAVPKYLDSMRSVIDAHLEHFIRGK